MQEENWKDFSYNPSAGLSPEFLLPKNETETMDTTEEPAAEKAPLSGGEETNQKRRLRSHKGDDDNATDFNRYFFVSYFFLTISIKNVF